MTPYQTRLQKRVFLLLAKFTIVFFSVMLLAAPNKLLAQATLTSDQEDYPPGSTVTLTGIGFQAGEAVRMQVLHTLVNGDNDASSAHDPWTTNADENGNFVTTWNVPVDEDELNATLLATADGQSSGTHAETTFTDANWKIGPSPLPPFNLPPDAYTNLCGGIEKEFVFSIQQTTSVAPNGRFRIDFPPQVVLSSASIVSVSASKNWNISLTGLPQNDVCLSAATSADALAINQVITFKVVATPPNIIGSIPLDGLSAAFLLGGSCTTSGTQATVPLAMLAVTKLSPAITQCPSNISVNTSPGLCSSVINYAPVITGTDLVISYVFSGATIAAGSGTGSGSAFNRGSTHVTITASNSCDTKTCSFDIAVSDHEAPAVPVLPDATGECSVTVSAPVANDNCAGAITGITSDPTSYSTQGTYTIHWSFNDGNGNTSSANQTVVVDDVTAPVVPSLETVTGECSATVSAPVANDNCAGAVTGITSDPTSYSTQGTYTIHWSFNDGNGNTSSANQTVVVDDVTAPVMPSLETVTGECSATVSAPIANDNCAGAVTGTTSDPTSYSTQGIYTIHWSFNDGNGNTSSANQTVVVDDVTAPVVPSLETVTGECSAAVSAPVATDNCAGAVTGTTSDPTSYSTQGTHTIHWLFDDGNGNTSAINQTVIIRDDIPPVINCLGNITLSACENIAAWSPPIATDNCSVSVQQTSGPASGSTFANGTTTTITYTATDAGGNQARCSFTVTRAPALVANCINTNPQLYFGYAADQASTIKVTPSGGVAPYTVSISMNRPLNCNVLTNAGDEVWVVGAGTTSSSGTTCPSSGPGVIPVSTATGVTTFYSVNVTLMHDADIIATVTDANGCTTTCTSHVSAEDVRCFAGNSSIAKITICHRTGSQKNPCVTICVDESALAEHLAHGDFLGKCTPDCIAPPVINTVVSSAKKESATPSFTGMLKATVLPNPSKTEFKLSLQSDSKKDVEIMVTDLYGRRLYQAKGNIRQKYTFGTGFTSGMYTVTVIQGNLTQTFKVIKE